MKEKGKRYLITGAVLIAAFLLWTILITHVDVQPAGQNGTNIGFARFNLWFHELTGVHLALYKLTDWLSVIPFLVCLFFAAVGLLQLIKGKSLSKVDPDIILLGIYYVLVILGYLFFEKFPINYRPILIDGALEASYPSSTTLLVLSVMPTLKFQSDRRFSRSLRKPVSLFVIIFSAFMVIGRIIAGVHWATDIVGGILLSAGLFSLYRGAVCFSDSKRKL